MNPNILEYYPIPCLKEEKEILYQFDKQLKMRILSSLLDLELKVKEVFVNNFISRYQDSFDEFLNEKNYSKHPMTKEVLDRVKKQLQDYELSQKDQEYYLKNYQKIPLFAFVKNCSFGVLRDLFFISKPNDKDHMSKKMTQENLSSKKIETLLEFLVKIRNICSHQEILFSFLSEKEMIPNTKYHQKLGNLPYGKKDFLAVIISMKCFLEEEEFHSLFQDVEKLIQKTKIPKKRIFYLMHLPMNYKELFYDK